MSCPLGFTALDGPSPHDHASMLHTGATPPPKAQPPQSDGRTPPPLPPRPKPKPERTWHEVEVLQGPVPAWASFISSWYNELWGLGRALLFASFLLALAPFLHVASWLAVALPLRVKAARTPCRLVCHPAYRCIQALYTGLIVCTFESLSGARLRFSGVVSTPFWERSSGGGLASSGAAGAPVTVFASNQTSYGDFLDAVVFFCVAYRRGQRSGLYFLPLDMQEWGLASGLAHFVFLAPLTVSSPQAIDLLLSYDTPCSFVWLPESTSLEDMLPSIPLLHQSSPGREDLLHVRSPHLSRLFVHLLAVTVAIGRAARRPFSIVDCTLAYSGSVLAEAEEARNTEATLVAGAADLDEFDEFDALTERDVAAQEALPDDEVPGYSADTINSYHVTAARSSRRQKLEPSVEVFCTAAPLRKLTPAEMGEDDTTSPSPPASNANRTTSSYARPSPSPKSRAALARARVVPTFYDFLRGNAPTQVHVLLNEYDAAYITSRIITVEEAASSAPQLTAAQESAAASSTALSHSLDQWLHQRFLHQEQQLTLFAVHACFHALPASLSASSIPISKPLESYAFPVSPWRLGLYVLVDWIVIILTTVAVRFSRSWMG